jgi:N-formylglutamate amidohydrolase
VKPGGVFSLHEGELPLLISVPHDGRLLPADLEAAMTPAGRLLPDTDWHVAELYDFTRNFGASLLVAGYSRYVVDLNRSRDDQALYAGQPSTGLCPTSTFAGAPIYTDGRDVSVAERDARADRYWQPYHDAIRQQLDRIRSRHGYALLWDAHSIAGEVPRLFDGELPILNIGTNAGQSCPAAIEQAVSRVAEHSPFSCVINGRFRGGYITRHYGEPADGCYAIQLELSQRCYMDELSLRYDPKRAAVLIETLRKMLQAFVDTAAVPGSDT